MFWYSLPFDLIALQYFYMYDVEIVSYFRRRQNMKSVNFLLVGAVQEGEKATLLEINREICQQMAKMHLLLLLVKLNFLSAFN